MIWSSFGVSFVSKSWEKLLEAWSWLYAPKYRSHRRASMGLDWIFRQPTEKSSGLFWTRAEPVLNPYFTRANPNFWHKYIVFFQNTMFLKRVLNPCQTRTLPVQTRTFCSGSEGSHHDHFCFEIWTIQVKIQGPHRLRIEQPCAVHTSNMQTSSGNRICAPPNSFGGGRCLPQKDCKLVSSHWNWKFDSW